MSAIAESACGNGIPDIWFRSGTAKATEKLKAKGAQVFIGHEARNVSGADLVVYSTALAKDNVEMQAPEQFKYTDIHRSQMLARLINERKGYCGGWGPPAKQQHHQ